MINLNTIKEIYHISVTDSGYKIDYVDENGNNSSEIFNEDTPGLEEFIENHQHMIMFDDNEDTPVIDNTSDKIAEAISGGQFRRGKLALLIQAAAAAGLDNIISGVLSKCQAEIERWKSDGDIDKLNQEFSSITDPETRGFLDYKLPNGISVQQYTIFQLK